MNDPAHVLDMLGLPAALGLPAPEPRTLAVIGLSDNPLKASNSVSAYMQQHGYRILPVNPAISSALGEKAYPTLASLPVKPDVVNVFRLPYFIPDIVDEMIALGLTNLWTQLGIINLPAAQKAEKHNINVVMDRCIFIEHRRLTFKKP
ncbi:MAG: CoA-binding protein [Acidobacteriota bacterium]